MRIIEDSNGKRTMSSALVAVLLGASLMMAGMLHGTSIAYATPYEVSGEKSYLTLPGTTTWDPVLERCALLDSMTVLSGRVLTVGQGVTLFVDAKAKVTSWGTITNQANATLGIAGKMTVNSGATLVNSGAFSNSGTLANSGVLVNSADAVVKNTGRITNAGTLTNLAGAAFTNSGSITNDAIINNQGHIENRGTLTVSKETMLPAHKEQL